MELICPVLFLLGVTITGTFVTKRKFEEVLPVAFTTGSIVLYIFTYMNKLMWGMFSLYAISVVGIVLVLVAAIRKQREFLIQTVLTPGMVFFVLLYVVLFFLNYHRGLSYWDEISHWAPMVKETLRLDDFYCVKESGLMVHKDYPPAVCMFETMLCKVAGGYRERTLFQAMQILLCSFFFPMFRQLSWKSEKENWVKYGLAIVVMVLIPYAIPLQDNFWLSSIYEDGILAVLLVFGYYLVLWEEKSLWTWYQLSLTLSFLLLTKQMGAAFMLLIVLFYFCSFLWKQVGRGIVASISVMIMPLLFLKSWSIRTAQYTMDRQFEIKDIEFLKIKDIYLYQYGEDWQQQATHNFLHGLFFRPINGVSYMTFVVISFVAFLLFFYIVRKQEKSFMILALAVVNVIGAAGYALTMLFLYTFCFFPDEGIGLACYERYMGCYCVAVILIGVISVIEYAKQSKDKKTYALLILFIAICVIQISRFRLWQEYLPAHNEQQTYAEYLDDVATIEANTPEEAKIFFVYEGHTENASFCLNYLTMPRIYNRVNWDTNMWHMSLKKYKRNLKKYDYLYLVHVDDTWNEKFGTKLGIHGEDGQLYKIKRHEKNVELLPVM